MFGMAKVLLPLGLFCALMPLSSMMNAAKLGAAAGKGTLKIMYFSTRKRGNCY